jgi:hypothetical protein
MKYAVADVTKRTCELIDCADFAAALAAAGLPRGETDHGLIGIGIGLFVHEHGLYVRPFQQRYFSIGGHLYAGNALLYAFDEAGETIDLTAVPLIRWLPTEVAVWEAIDNGEIALPELRVDGELIWRWPQAKPDLAAVAERWKA